MFRARKVSFLRRRVSVRRVRGRAALALPERCGAEAGAAAPSSASGHGQPGLSASAHPPGAPCAPWSHSLLKSEPVDHRKRATSPQPGGPRKILAQDVGLRQEKREKT
ncbi:unnamed protein product [Coccothraustes coccothraustes]